ncbi:MAG: type II secretion system F family protein [Roseibium album]|uniref:Flp pilus assembly protein TadB n=1 Tax=Roseibium album TaxID=311410 RepID=A0A0M6ZGZ4_9HYPH|nr:type II secretion system F family protein [Roseibium album]MBG6145870.1 tight adherence protein C [Labrenzia sp. EL_142]MBG6154717.1 tight adherence protein C [Labrenzia sp. EL_162]MBG6161995.1 tight adherence protein C [Labrenzia sp. EL_195]MBG6176248.1 tight adherence protein C [Labrenzia sp. EL_132]MBG6193153.1 tight adherence protein C [Labrenzia sp. EL_159]MBG6211318.1 tight adherence protein C [Labrenzia sp. EL_126]MBG6231284.1 tight adherence protein C [Labrenzia sp. EL_208]MCR906
MDLETIASSQFLAGLLAMIAVTGTIFSLVAPILSRDVLKSRMKTVAIERDKLRAKERARLQSNPQDARASLRNQPKAQMKSLVDRLNLKEMLSDEHTMDKLRMAGYRGSAPLYYFLTARIALPAIILVIALFYAFVVIPDLLPTVAKVCLSIAIAGIGAFLPNLFLKNKIDKRKLNIQRAWPDALDLMLICVESGMSIEGAFQKVAEEVGVQSVDLAEELSLTTAELSYLSERRGAYENLAKRTGVDGVKNVMMALIQAERYGTPVGTAIRTMADDTREQRMLFAEQKAASLPPKLTVPMILFFLPVLFFIIMSPAVMQVMELDSF